MFFTLFRCFINDTQNNKINNSSGTNKKQKINRMSILYNQQSNKVKRFHSSGSLKELKQQSQIRVSEVSLNHNLIDKKVHIGSFQFVLNRMSYSFMKIYLYSKKKHQGKIRLVHALYRIFRTSNYQLKFQAFQFLRKIQIAQQMKQLKYTKETLGNMYKIGIRLFVTMMRNKKRTTLLNGMRRLKLNAKWQNSDRIRKIMRMYKITVEGVRNQLKDGLYKIKTSRIIHQRKKKVHKIINILKEARCRALSQGFNTVKRHMLRCKEAIIKNDIQEIQYKINNPNSSEVESFKEKQHKLQINLDQIAKQKQAIIETSKNELKQIEEKCNTLKQQKERILNENQKIKKQIQKLNSLINQQYTMDQICQFCYNNMLLFLHEHQDQPISKQQLLQSMQNPLLPLNVNSEKIKEQNQVMNQLLSEYLVLFGPKELEKNYYQMPYQYVVKQNYILHKILMTMLGRMNLSRDDIGIIRQGIYGVVEAVKELQKCGKKEEIVKK